MFKAGYCCIVSRKKANNTLQIFSVLLLRGQVNNWHADIAESNTGSDVVSLHVKTAPFNDDHFTTPSVSNITMLIGKLLSQGLE